MGVAPSAKAAAKVTFTASRSITWSTVRAPMGRGWLATKARISAAAASSRHKSFRPSSMRGRMLEGRRATTSSQWSRTRVHVAGPFSRPDSSMWMRNGAFWVRTSVRVSSKARAANRGWVKPARA